MNKLSRAVMTGLFVLSGLIHTKNAEAQSDLPGNAVRSGIVMGGNKNADVLAKIDDKDFLKRQDSLGLELQDRGFGQITMKDENGHMRKANAMFYTYKSQANGHDVTTRTILAHHWKDSTNNTYGTDNLFYRDFAVSKDGKFESSMVCNYATFKELGIFNKFATVATNGKGKQVLLQLERDHILNGMDNVIGNNPDALNGFVNDATSSRKNSRLDYAVKTPGFSGQDLGNGTFQIINVDEARLSVAGQENRYTGPGGP